MFSESIVPHQILIILTEQGVSFLTLRATLDARNGGQAVVKFSHCKTLKSGKGFQSGICTSAF